VISEVIVRVFYCYGLANDKTGSYNCCQQKKIDILRNDFMIVELMGESVYKTYCKKCSLL